MSGGDTTPLTAVSLVSGQDLGAHRRPTHCGELHFPPKTASLCCTSSQPMRPAHELAQSQQGVGGGGRPAEPCVCPRFLLRQSKGIERSRVKSHIVCVKTKDDQPMPGWWRRPGAGGDTGYPLSLHMKGPRATSFPRGRAGVHLGEAGYAPGDPDSGTGGRAQ